MLWRYLRAPLPHTRHYQGLVSRCPSGLGLHCYQRAAAAARRPQSNCSSHYLYTSWQHQIRLSGMCYSTAERESDPAYADPRAIDDAQSATLPWLVFDQHARLTVAAQAAWFQVLNPGDTAVDATCGNGHDTLALARAVGRDGTVYGIDIQEAAVAATRQRLEQELPAEAFPQLHVVRACHSRLQEIVGSGRAKVVVFNCGYLPRGDKAITTSTQSTLAAVEAALEVVCPGGVISITAYVGHEGGADEYKAVHDMIAGLSSTYWTSSELRLLNRPRAPVLLCVWRYPDKFRAPEVLPPG